MKNLRSLLKGKNITNLSRMNCYPTSPKNIRLYIKQLLDYLKERIMSIIF